MTVIRSNNWAELLTPGLREIFDKHISQKKDYVPVLFNVETSQMAAERNMGVGAMGLMDEWVASGRKVSYEQFAKGFLSTYTHKKYSKGIEIDRDLVDDDQYGEIRKRVKMLAQSVYFTRQNHAASVFNSAFDAGVLGPDGKPLCAVDHPVAPGSGTVYTNAGTLALTADNVEATRTAMKLWKDDKGNLLGVNPDTLIVPTALRKTALVIADSDKEPGGNLNNVNIWQGSLRVIEYDFLTDTNAWFLVDSERAANYLNWYDRRKAVLAQDKEDFDLEVGRFKTVARYSFGWDDPTFIFGQNPS